MSEMKLGEEVKCMVTGYQGIVTAELKRLNGTIEYEVQKQVSEDNKYPPSTWINQNFLEKVGEGVHVEPVKNELGFKVGRK